MNPYLGKFIWMPSKTEGTKGLRIRARITFKVRSLERRLIAFELARNASNCLQIRVKMRVRQINYRIRIRIRVRTGGWVRVQMCERRSTYTNYIKGSVVFRAVHMVRSLEMLLMHGHTNKKLF